MKKDSANMTVAEKFQHLFDVMSSKRFLRKEGLGNEVPFFICAYEPEDAVEMEKARRQLANRLEQSGIAVLEVNLYDFSISILQERGLWQSILEKEAEIDKDQLKELLQGVLDSEAHIIPAIAAKMETKPHDVMFLSGVGEVYPYIRSHNVLNNLQSKAKEKPTVLFFPGRYTHSLADGASLDLFGLLHDDKYYRAFDIFQYEV